VFSGAMRLAPSLDFGMMRFDFFGPMRVAPAAIFAHRTLFISLQAERVRLRPWIVGPIGQGLTRGRRERGRLKLSDARHPFRRCRSPRTALKQRTVRRSRRSACIGFVSTVSRPAALLERNATPFTHSRKPSS
jgi:hypothetical protein